MLATLRSLHIFPLIIALVFSTALHTVADDNASAPASRVPLDQLGFFGISGDAHTGLDLSKWVPQMAQIGIHVMRSARPSDPDQMAYLDTLNIKYGYLLHGLPPGDTIDLPGTLPVKDLPAWKAHVADLVKKARGRVCYWEVWNEPPNGIGHHQTAADYARLLVATYDTIKALDPTIPVAMCAKSVHVNWLEKTIQAGAKDHFDFIVLHPYEVLGTAVEHPGPHCF